VLRRIQRKAALGREDSHHALFTETLSDWYPGAKIIHLLRDPRDAVASLKRMPWAPNAILENAGIWLVFNRAARRSRHRSGYLPVHYEFLVTQPEQELTRICAHLEEPYSPEMLLPEKESAATHSPLGSFTTQRLGKWREDGRSYAGLGIRPHGCLTIGSGLGAWCGIFCL